MKEEDFEQWKFQMDAPLVDEPGTMYQQMFRPRKTAVAAVRSEAQLREDAESFLAIHGGR